MAFDSFPDPKQRADLIRERAARLAATPVKKFTYKDVTFTGTGTDVLVAHDLAPTAPESVHYIVCKINVGAVVYNDTSATRLPWQQTHIYLRASAPCVAHILLYIHDANEDT